MLSDLQTRVISYDDDTGVLAIALCDGSSYSVTNAGHAIAIYDKISLGGRISAPQRDWLERYRIQSRSNNRERLLACLKQLRAEIRQWRADGRRQRS